MWCELCEFAGVAVIIGSETNKVLQAPAAHAQLAPTRNITVIKVIPAARAAWNLKVLLRDSRRLLLAMAVTISSMSEMVTQVLLIVLYAM